MAMLSINLGYLISLKLGRLKTKQLMMIPNIKTNQQFLSFPSDLGWISNSWPVASHTFYFYLY